MFPVFTLDNGFRMGILICFDRSFPEAWKALTLQGVDLIVVPTATYGFRKDLYLEELRVRALENNIYVMGVNKAGFEQLPEEGIPRTHFGQSCLIDPFGEKIAVAGEQEWTYVTGEIISAEIEKSKQRVNFLKERKREVYQKYITNVNVFAKN
jgi:beta-ureidopropionase